MKEKFNFPLSTVIDANVFFLQIDIFVYFYTSYYFSFSGLVAYVWSPR